jgi:hypothetical protein
MCRSPICRTETNFDDAPFVDKFIVSFFTTLFTFVLIIFPLISGRLKAEIMTSFDFFVLFMSFPIMQVCMFKSMKSRNGQIVSNSN